MGPVLILGSSRDRHIRLSALGVLGGLRARAKLLGTCGTSIFAPRDFDHMGYSWPLCSRRYWRFLRHHSPMVLIVRANHRINRDLRQRRFAPLAQARYAGR